MKIMAEEFAAVVGRAPERDDLERCNCEIVGTVGHMSCGWCFDCNLPRFECGHGWAVTNTARSSGQVSE